MESCPLGLGLRPWGPIRARPTPPTCASDYLHLTPLHKYGASFHDFTLISYRWCVCVGTTRQDGQPRAKFEGALWGVYLVV